MQLMEEGKRETRSALPPGWRIVKNKDLVLRGVKRWIASNVMPTEQEMLDADPVWEQDLVMARAAYEFIEDAPAVAAKTNGAIAL